MTHAVHMKSHFLHAIQWYCSTSGVSNTCNLSFRFLCQMINWFPATHTTLTSLETSLHFGHMYESAAVYLNVLMIRFSFQYDWEQNIMRLLQKANVNIPDSETIIVTTPTYFKALAGVLNTTNARYINSRNMT